MQRSNKPYLVLVVSIVVFIVPNEIFAMIVHARGPVKTPSRCTCTTTNRVGTGIESNCGSVWYSKCGTINEGNLCSSRFQRESSIWLIGADNCVQFNFKTDLVGTDPLQQLVDDAQSQTASEIKGKSVHLNETSIITKQKQKLQSSRKTICASILLLLGGGIAYTTFGILPIVDVPVDKMTSTLLSSAMIFFNAKLFPVVLESLKRIILMEIWQNAWKHIHNAIQNTLDLSCISFQHEAPEWISERLPQPIRTMFRKGTRKIVQRKIQKNVEGMISRFLSAALGPFLIATDTPAMVPVPVTV